MEALRLLGCSVPSQPISFGPHSTLAGTAHTSPSGAQYSSFYYSRPQGFFSDHEFCNCCARVESDLEPLDFLHFTQQIERQLGRTRKSVNGEHFDREIDIDILLAYPSQPLGCLQPSLSASRLLAAEPLRLNTPELTLPHPKMAERDFVMLPLQEILQKNA